MYEFRGMMAIAYILQAIGSNMIYSAFLRKKNERQNLYIFIVIVIYTILWCFYSTDLFLLNIVLFTLGNYLIIHSFYSNNIFIKIGMTFFYSGLMSFTEIIVLYAMKLIKGNNYDLGQGEIAVLAIISKVILLISIEIIIYKKKNNIDLIQGKQFFMFIVSMFFILVHLYMIADLTAYMKVSIDKSLIMIIVTVGFMFSVIMMFHEFCQHAKDQEKLREDCLMLQKMKNDIRYYEQLRNNYDQIMVIKHDLPKHMDILGRYANSKDISSLIEYISIMNLNAEKVLSVANTGNKVLDMIIDNKIRQTEKNNIVFKWYIKNDLKFMDDMDIVAIMGNILDNAVESCQRCSNGEIILDIYLINGNSLSIIVENTCINVIQSTDNQLKTMKSDEMNHGYGIKSIKTVVNKYNGELSYYFDKENNKLITDVSIPVTS